MTAKPTDPADGTAFSGSTGTPSRRRVGLVLAGATILDHRRCRHVARGIASAKLVEHHRPPTGRRPPRRFPADGPAAGAGLRTLRAARLRLPRHHDHVDQWQ